jgi:WD40 repeat protein
MVTARWTNPNAMCRGYFQLAKQCEELMARAKSTAGSRAKSQSNGSSGLTPTWTKMPISTPQEYVNSVAISGDGQTIVAGTFYFPYAAGAKHSQADVQLIPVGTFAWNAKGKSLWQDKFQATEGVYWVSLSRDGQWAAAAGLAAAANGFVYAYNAASGTRVCTFNTKTRVNMVAFSNDGSFLVAGSDEIYLFARTGTTWGAPAKIPVASGDSVVAVAISGDGQWIVAGTFKGSVILVKNNSGTLGVPVTWQLVNGSIHWVAMSADGSTFAIAGSDAAVHCFQTSSFGAKPQPAWSAPLTGCTGCRSVALCDNGSLLSAAGNSKTAGKVIAFANNGTSGKLLWSQATKRNPNSTSIDSAGSYLTAADGYPDQTPGDFYLFKSDGTLVGSFTTSNMSWPMQISADASAIAAGSDDSNVYYFSIQ